MTRFLDSLASTLAGMILGVLLVAAIAPGAWVPASRSGQHAERPFPPGRMTTEVPSPDVAGRSRTPEPAPAVAAVPGAAVTVSPMPAGWATWYAAGPGQAAAGPALRAALGPGWRGQLVTVSVPDRKPVVVRLSDWCACADRHGRPTLIDLDRAAFASLAEPSRGVIAVTVRRALPTPPPTATEP